MPVHAGNKKVLRHLTPRNRSRSFKSREV
jgi:hypothetical protein